MTRATSTLFALIAVIGAAIAGCADDSAPGSGGSGSGNATSSGESSSSSGGSSGSGATSSSSGGAVAPELKVIAAFAAGATSTELPDGLAITPDGKTAYVGFGGTGKIVKVSLPDGKVTPFGSVPSFPAGSALMLGLILDTNGDLFAARTGPANAGAGVYKIDKTSGASTLFVEDSLLSFPNGFGFLADGSLLVTDSFKGVIFRIDVKSKQIAQWVSDPLLVGDISTANKCQDGLRTFAVGSNGITSIGDQVYVTNTDTAKIIRIPINFDGTAGKPVELLTGDPVSCAPLRGADGLTADADGSLYLVGNTGNSLLRIPKGGTAVEKLIDNNGQLDFPATVVISTLEGKRYAYITNFSINTKAKPALLAYGPLP